jgi:hypothetical protein
MNLKASIRNTIMTAALAGLSAMVLLSSCAGSASVTKQRSVTWVDQALRFEIHPLAKTQSVRLTIQKPLGKVVWIKLKDAGGDVLESYSLGKQLESVDRVYNFTDAPEGEYSFEISDREKTMKKTVKLQFQKVEAVTELVID